MRQPRTQSALRIFESVETWGASQPVNETIRDDAKEQIRQAIDIVDLVGSYRRCGAKVGITKRSAHGMTTRALAASEPTTAVVQMLGLQHRRRHLQFLDEDGEHRVPPSTRYAGRTSRRFLAALAGSQEP